MFLYWCRWFYYETNEYMNKKFEYKYICLIVLHILRNEKMTVHDTNPVTQSSFSHFLVAMLCLTTLLHVDLKSHKITFLDDFTSSKLFIHFQTSLHVWMSVVESWEITWQEVRVFSSPSPPSKNMHFHFPHLSFNFFWFSSLFVFFSSFYFFSLFNFFPFFHWFIFLFVVWTMMHTRWWEESIFHPKRSWWSLENPRIPALIPCGRIE